jgi:hypothetical protein
MIERVVVDGRPGSLCYLDQTFKPLNEKVAVLASLVFGRRSADGNSTAGRRRNVHVAFSISA